MSLPRWKRRAFLLLISVASCIAKGRAFASPFENLAQLSIVRSTSSVPLGLWERGHLRMYLEQNGYGCQLTMKKTPLRGELSLKLEVEERHAVVTTIVDAKGLKPAAFPPRHRERWGRAAM